MLSLKRLMIIKKINLINFFKQIGVSMADKDFYEILGVGKKQVMMK